MHKAFVAYIMNRSKSTASLDGMESEPPTDLPKTKNPRKSIQSSPTKASAEAVCSRSGRVRKAKVVFDPSDHEAKRRSMPIIETEKAKKPKLEKIEVKKSPVVQPKSPPPVIEKKVARLDLPIPINKRRQTINVVCDNPCIVCTRSDIKKGRFVNCMDCLKRGHFTCLRLAKFFKSKDDENYWQCPECKICDICRNTKENEPLYKCQLCFNSYHVKCTLPNSKNVTKKHFQCGICQKMNATKNGTTKNSTDTLSPPTAVLVKKSVSDGFAGFSQEETAEDIRRKSSSSLGRRSDELVKPKKSGKLITDIRPSTKSDGFVRSVQSADVSPESVKPEPVKTEPLKPKPKVQASGASDFGIKRFKVMKLQEQVKKEEIEEEKVQVSQLNESEKDVKIDDEQNIVTTNADEIDDDDAKTEIIYNTKTAMTPHEMPDVRKWDCDEVYTYFMGLTSAEYAHLFKEHQIDGDALLLIKREDVLNRFNLKLGPALRLYSLIVALQYKNNNPILTWREE